MKKELIRLANHLDNIGLTKEADFLDGIIKKIAMPGFDPDRFKAPPKLFGAANRFINLETGDPAEAGDWLPEYYAFVNIEKETYADQYLIVSDKPGLIDFMGQEVELKERGPHLNVKDMVALETPGTYYLKRKIFNK